LLKRTIVALLSLSVLFFGSTEANVTNNIARENIFSEERVVSAQADETDTTNAQTQEVSEENAAVQDTIVIRTYSAKASWYRHGRITANGEKFDPMGFTVAHKSLPFGTIVRFTNPETGQSVTTRVNDRGPFVRGREFDLSLASARALGMEQIGVMTLLIEVLNGCGVQHDERRERI
jgi:rare lipoprotein A